jgi:hypothetical protein
VISDLKNSRVRKNWYTLILVVLLVPSYFIHTDTYPDWGDDFAQYIYQAQQIHSPSERYKQVLNVEEYSSPKRSVAFSLMLSVIQPTLQIERYINLISLSYILAGISLFIFLSIRFSLSVSLVATLCVYYNFLFLRLKSEVVPEFLFMGLFYVVLYLIQKKIQWTELLVPLLLGLLFSVRFVGLSLLVSYLIYIFLEKGPTVTSKLKTALLGSAIFLVVVFIINQVFLVTVYNREVGLYGGLVFKDYSLNTLMENLSIYPRYLTLFFEQEIPFWMNWIIKCLTMISFFIGFLASMRKNVSIQHLSLIVYSLFLFFYPYNGDTIKYLIPVFPLVIYFMIEGMCVVLNKINFHKNFLIVFCLSVLLLSNSKTVWLAIHNSNRSIGPYDQTVLEDFEKIKAHVGLNESVAFGKPFLINLLGDRDSYFVSGENHRNVFSKSHYFLSPKEKLGELFPKIKGIKVVNGDTTDLENFYLIKLSKQL